MSIEKLDFTHVVQQKIPFTTFINSVLQNISDPIALAIWVFLSSLPPTWEVNKAHLMKKFDIGRDKLHKHMSYLKEVDLIELVQDRNKDGTMGNSHIIVKPYSSYFDQFNRSTENPYSGLTGLLNNRPTENPEPGESVPIKETLSYKINTTTSYHKKIAVPPSSSSNNLLGDFKDAEVANLEIANDDYKNKQLAAEFKEQALNDNACIETYERRFNGLDVTLEQLYEACADYWRQTKQLVYKDRFLAHLKRCPVDKYREIPREGQVTRVNSGVTQSVRERIELNQRFNDAPKEVKQARRENGLKQISGILQSLRA